MSKEGKEFLQQNWLTLSLTAILALVIVAILYLIARSEPQTRREATLEALVLTGLSILVSVLATKVYAELNYSRSLRDHGVQIASGIMVLKRQVEALSDWVVGKRSGPGKSSASPEVVDATLDHVEQTLGGFRAQIDAALGGISGVIGGALEEYEAVREKIGRIRIEAGEETTKIREEIKTAASSEEVSRLQAQMQEIAFQTEKRISQLALKSAFPIPEAPRERPFRANCPYCGKENSFEMTDRLGETRSATCQECGHVFNAHVAAGHQVITRQLPLGQIRALATPLQEKARAILMKAQAWVTPEQVAALVPLVVGRDSSMKQPGQIRSPFELQAALFLEADKLAQAGTGRIAVRRFLKMVYNGRGFQFALGARPSFRTPYINNLEERGLLGAYVGACLWRLAPALPMTVEDSPTLASLLLGDKGGVDLVREVIVESRDRWVGTGSVGALDRTPESVHNNSGLLKAET